LCDIVANEWIEGVMIQLFYDKRMQRWEISTKSSVAGNYVYKQGTRGEGIMEGGRTEGRREKTYREMFMEALYEKSDGVLNDSVIVQQLSPDYCYCFVMQHPDNPICLPIIKPQLYLVNVFEIIQNEEFAWVRSISPRVYESWSAFANLVGVIQFPKWFEWSGDEDGYDDLLERVNSARKDMFHVGYILTNYRSGKKPKLQNKTYSRIDKMMRIQPCDLYNYLCLCKTGKCNDFLIKYPGYMYIFYQYTLMYNSMISNVQNAYYMRYVRKSISDEEMSKKYSHHVYHLHKDVYLPSLRRCGRGAVGIKINKQVVRDYFNSFDPHQLLYFLSFERRMYGQYVQTDYF